MLGKSLEERVAAEAAKLDEDIRAEIEEIEKEYVHVAGTTHLNAFVAEVEEAKQKVRVAQGELGAALERLRQKKIESGMINGN